MAPTRSTVYDEMVNVYRKLAKDYYKGANGRCTNEPENIRLALEPLCDVYGMAAVAT